MIEFYMHSKLRNLFLPKRHKNHHRAHLASIKALRFYTLSALVIFSFLKFGNGDRVLGYATDIKETEIIKLSNDLRNANGLTPLIENKRLSEAARLKAEHMFANNYWAHIAPDGTSPWKFFDSVGYNYYKAGENLARDFNSSNEVIRGWLGSTKHRENLLGPFNDIGVAVVNGKLNGNDTTLVVQLFGTTSALISTKQQYPSLSATKVPASIGNVDQLKKLSEEMSSESNEDLVKLPFQNFKLFIFIFTFILAIMYLLDFIHSIHENNKKQQSSALAHFVYLTFILLLMYYSQFGKIL